MIRSIEKSNELIGNRNRDLPACSIVTQPTTLLRASSSASVQAENHPQVGPTFVDISHVSILDPLPKHRKKTAAVLRNKGHFNQAKTTGLG
jgi:hypothetical protein